ncbi:MAG: AhpC/TSA family protein [Alistipes sp.]|nr:AhpC/TSA family protein [Alistipes sp.]
MKKSMSLLLAATALCGCGGNSYTLRGTITPGRTDSVFLHSIEKRDEPRLAAAAVDQQGTFVIKGRIEKPEIVVLNDRYYEPIATIFLEPGEIRLTTGPMGQIAVTGTPSNDAYTPVSDSLQMMQGQFLSALESGDMSRVDSLDRVAHDIIRRAMEHNTDNQAGIFFFSNLFPEMEPDEARATLERFSGKHADHFLLGRIRQAIDAMENTRIGAPYMEIELRDTADEKLALSSLIGPGKWVLIDFWATWCGPCRGEIPHLKQAFEEFGPKGFTIYGVSLDNDREGWKNFVAEQRMEWPNVIGIENGQSAPAVEAYGIRSIPANFLISPEGKIVASGLRGDDLRAKLAELIR